MVLRPNPRITTTTDCTPFPLSCTTSSPTVMVNAFYLESKQQVPISSLEEFGLMHRHLDPVNYEKELSEIEEKHGYGHRSEVICSPDNFGENYDSLMSKFFEEHFHEFPEIRFIMDGIGYFDVRDKKDKWIRVEVQAGDLIVLPAGMYHRFSLDETQYLKAMRLFLKGTEPVWTACNRAEQKTIK